MVRGSARRSASSLWPRPSGAAPIASSTSSAFSRAPCLRRRMWPWFVSDAGTGLPIGPAQAVQRDSIFGPPLTTIACSTVPGASPPSVPHVETNHDRPRSPAACRDSAALAAPHVSDAVLDRLARATSGSLTTQLYIKGFRQPVLHGLTPLNRKILPFAGRAYTMRFIPAREDVDVYGNLTTEPNADNLQWVGVEQIEPGHVLVIDSNNDGRAAVDGQHAHHADDDARRRAAWSPTALPRRHRAPGDGLSDLVHRRDRDHAAGLPPRGRPAGADRLRGRGRLPGRRDPRRRRQHHRDPRAPGRGDGRPVRAARRHRGLPRAARARRRGAVGPVPAERGDARSSTANGSPPAALPLVPNRRPP